jgi:HD-GYP domain-containing protein (c-di-GMP phosphodiesterase class II)
MFDISHNVIGVIQLINRKRNRQVQLRAPENFREMVVPFDEVDQEMAEIVAQQAGIALENANMQQNIQDLFDGLVNASVTAIEQRDPTTSGHSHRVAHLTVGLAQIVHNMGEGIYRDIRFNADQMQEIKYASLLHDFGKLGVRENVLVKAKKLYPWEMDRMLTRFELIRASHEIDYLRKVIEYLQTPDHFPMGANPYTFEFEKNQRVAELEEYLRFVIKANEPTVLEQGGFEKLKDIANLHFKNLKGEKHPYLLSEELKALSVSRGSLTREEFAEIQSHVTHTFEFLRQIPWGKRLANVPQIAAKHHEKLDGSGYPTSAEADEIPIQTRMMTIADIFDALTAADRPYKKAVPVDRALDILEMEVKGGKVDVELFRLFCESKVYEPVLDPNFVLKS